jgi:proteasome lid subunit RPN8/RPN11
MSAATPATLRTDRHCLIVLERVLRAAAPEEGCALLLGQRRDSLLLLERIWPCCNNWQPAAERLRRFRLDPREQLLAQRWARSRQQLVLGAAHSHPGSAAIPSATDLSLCCGPTLMVIRSGRHDSQTTSQNDVTGPPGPDAALTLPLRAWWIAEGAGWAVAARPEAGSHHPPHTAQELAIELTPQARAGHLGE